MQTVPRHDIDQDFARQQVEACERRSFERYLPTISERRERVRQLFDSAVMTMKYRCALDPMAEQPQTWQSVTLAMQAGTAMFAAALRTQGTVEVRLHDSEVAIPATGAQTWTNVGYWLDALYLAMICREDERTNLLCSVSLDFLRASEKGGIVPPHLYAWAESLQRFWRGEPGSLERVEQALELAKPHNIEEPGGDAQVLLAMPPMLLFAHLLVDEDDEFNGALAEALQWHRMYWTSTPENARRSIGYISLPLLAMTCLAHDKGFVPIEVESPYIPKGLVDRRWVGEFPT
ncbi:immunity 49 family protein [Thermomonospora amylolytica]|uniref:immunity 49 family protein n=1 Tax=Thermomonospora amylolytica TaxID=1411117 RepID=UPI000E6BD463|nr:immunity 49 family protein [Thermomonospora amylolytica]